MSIDIPKANVVFGAVTPNAEDIIDVQVHLGCTREVSSFTVQLDNSDGKYNEGGAKAITVGMEGHIDIGRGSTIPQIIACRVEDVAYESVQYGEIYAVISGRCFGERLFRRIVTKTYENKKAEYIVKDLLDNYVGLSHNRGGTELVENTDTTYTKLEYENTPAMDILEYIAGSAVKSGVMGFDFRVAPDGKFEFFPINSKTSPVSLEGKIESNEYHKGISRVRNKIMVYGIADKSVPLNKDDWTEELTPTDGVWTAIAPATIALDATKKVRGQVSIKTNINSQPIGAGCLFTLNSGKEVNSNLYPTLNFWSVLESTFNGHGMLTLRDISGKMASKLITAGFTDWAQTNISVGAGSVDSWFSIQTGFDWTQIKSIQIFYYFPTGTYSGTFWVDGLYFGGRRYSAIREDPNSIGYPRELTETDEELKDDTACDLRAQALLAYYKDPAQYFTITSSVVDYGSTPILAGDKAYNYRVDSIEYNADGQSQLLELTIEFGKTPPRLADYMYGARSTTVTIEKLARTKLGKMALLSGGGGGGVGGSGSSDFRLDADSFDDVRGAM